MESNRSTNRQTQRFGDNQLFEIGQVLCVQDQEPAENLWLRRGGVLPIVKRKKHSKGSDIAQMDPESLARKLLGVNTEQFNRVDSRINYQKYCV